MTVLPGSKLRREINSRGNTAVAVAAAVPPIPPQGSVMSSMPTPQKVGSAIGGSESIALSMVPLFSSSFAVIMLSSVSTSDVIVVAVSKSFW